MSVSVAQVQAKLFLIAPVFETVDPTELAQLQDMIADNIGCVNENYFKSRTLQAVALLTAHDLAVANLMGDVSLVSGSVKKEKNGDQEIEYNAPSSKSDDDSYYFATKYGQQFLSILKRVLVPSFTLNRCR